jgi:hypothetical protein
LTHHSLQIAAAFQESNFLIFGFFGSRLKRKDTNAGGAKMEQHYCPDLTNHPDGELSTKRQASTSP